LEFQPIALAAVLLRFQMNPAGERFPTTTRNLSEIGSPESPSIPKVAPWRHLQPSACKTHYITTAGAASKPAGLARYFPGPGSGSSGRPSVAGRRDF